MGHSGKSSSQTHSLLQEPLHRSCILAGFLSHSPLYAKNGQLYFSTLEQELTFSVLKNLNILFKRLLDSGTGKLNYSYRNKSFRRLPSCRMGLNYMFQI